MGAAAFEAEDHGTIAFSLEPEASDLNRLHPLVPAETLVGASLRPRCGLDD